MRVAKILLGVVGAVIVLLVVAVVIVASTFDPNEYKGVATDAFTARTGRTLTIDEDLRHAVLDYVRTAKAERRTPELVIVSLKRAIVDAAAAKISYRAANELTDRVVRWFIDGYYGPDGAPDRSRDLRLGPTPRAT